MKKVIIVTLAIFLAFQSVCVAESEGIFVPSYQAFMDSFYNETSGIDTIDGATLLRFCDDTSVQKWSEVANHTDDRFVSLGDGTSIELSTHESWGQLMFVSIRMSVSASDEEAESFMELYHIICQAINPTADEVSLDRLSNLVRLDRIIEKRGRGRDTSRTNYAGLHAYTSEIHDGYVYFYVELMRSEESEYFQITPHGYKRK